MASGSDVSGVCVISGGCGDRGGCGGHGWFWFSGKVKTKCHFCLAFYVYENKT